jgi:hypothetical protein
MAEQLFSFVNLTLYKPFLLALNSCSVSRICGDPFRLHSYMEASGEANRNTVSLSKSGVYYSKFTNQFSCPFQYHS